MLISNSSKKQIDLFLKDPSNSLVIESISQKSGLEVTDDLVATESVRDVVIEKVLVAFIIERRNIEKVIFFNKYLMEHIHSLILDKFCQL